MLAFVHIVKIAGTTLNWIVRSSFGVHHVDRGPRDSAANYFSTDDFRRFSRVDSYAGHKVRAYDDLAEAVPGIRYYTFLREPVTRMPPCQHGVQGGDLKMSPEEWLEGRRNG